MAVCGGIGFGRGFFAVKELELGLALNTAPHDTTTGDKVAGYGATTHNTSYQGHEEADPFPRKMRMGPHGHHESNHTDACKESTAARRCVNISLELSFTWHESGHGVVRRCTFGLSTT